MAGVANESAWRTVVRAGDDELRAFWAVYASCRAEVTKATETAARAMPEFAAVLASTSDEVRSHNQQRSWELQKAAVLRGEWGPYVRELHQRGAAYAQLGIPFGAWSGLLTAFRRPVLARLEEQGSPAAMATATIGMDRFIDIVQKPFTPDELLAAVRLALDAQQGT